jgi:hypothetical protein
MLAREKISRAPPRRPADGSGEISENCLKLHPWTAHPGPGRSQTSAPRTPTQRPAPLGMAVVAMLAGMSSYEAVVQCSKEWGSEFLQHLGFPAWRGLCNATYPRVFRLVDVADLEAWVGRWIAYLVCPAKGPNPLDLLRGRQ